MNEDLNIFQAILLNNFEVVEHLLDTARTDYIVHIKATDSLGRYVHGVAPRCGSRGTICFHPQHPLEIGFSGPILRIYIRDASFQPLNLISDSFLPIRAL